MRALHFVLTLILAAASASAQDPRLRFGGEIPPEVDAIYERGLEWLAQAQSEEGNWQGGQQGSGVDGLCVMAFLASGEDPNFGRWALPIRKALRHMVASQDARTGYLPSSMYHHGFAMLALAEAYGTVDETALWQGAEKQGRSLAEALDLAIRCAATSQQKNSLGAWRYTPDSTDADTSVTGAVLMGLLAARNAGMDVPDKVIDRALVYMRRSTSPNGFVAYSGGFGGMGESMNRSAIATLVASVSKQQEKQRFKATLKHLTDRLEHRESGHPFYFRYYMAQALFQGDYEAWQKWNGMTIRQLTEQQNENGSFGDAYGTSMSLLALALNYRFLPIYER